MWVCSGTHIESKPRSRKATARSTGSIERSVANIVTPKRMASACLAGEAGEKFGERRLLPLAGSDHVREVGLDQQSLDGLHGVWRQRGDVVRQLERSRQDLIARAPLDGDARRDNVLGREPLAGEEDLGGSLPSHSHR